VKELQHALGNGFIPQRIEVTGPKSMELLSLAVQHAVWINLDSIAELKDLIYVSRRLGSHQPLQVLLRLADFSSEHSRFINKSSRFGISIHELDTALDELEAAPNIELAGFSFHLDTISVLERTVAVENCMEAFETAVNRGFSPRILDIGGGYKVNYLESAEDWNRYTSALKEAVMGTAESITWQGNSFGLHTEKGVLKGNFNTYSYYDSQTGGQFLDELLNQKLPSLGNTTVASMLRDNMIELWIEPGRALLDQCGLTVAKVETVRRATSGDTIVNLSMKRQDVCFLDQEIFVDPVIVRRANRDTARDTKSESEAVYFAGNLCLESDLIYRHKTFVDSLPEPGDFVAFINTAGYFMDFSASQSIMQPVARKVAITRESGRLRWFLDDRFSPFSKGR
jgi:diaminopimelate decarboxylase